MQQILSAGSLIAGRFEIEKLVNNGALGQIYKASDKERGQAIGMRIIPRSLLSDTDIDIIKRRVPQAAALVHRNIRATYGMGVDKAGFVFIAVEWIDGHNLKTLLKKRTAAGKRFSFKGAYNIVGHLCNALTYIHESAYHGGLSPRAIMVNDAGRVKIQDVALSTLRITKPDYAGRQTVESAYWAPEVLKDATSASSASDIYSLGAIFYEMITGAPPTRPLKAPSQLGFSREVDSIIARCMSADPRQRYRTAQEVKEAISALAKDQAAPKTVVDAAGAAGAALDDELGIDIDIDLSGLTTENVTTIPQGVAGAPVAAPPSAHPAGSMLSAPGLPPPPADAAKTSFSASSGTDDRVSTIDMAALMARFGQAETARWMVQKDKFDHGPFSDRELVQMIMQGEVLGHHILLDMDTGVRKKVRAWNDFEDFLEAWRLKKKKMDEEAALQRTEKAETRGIVFKLVIGLSVLGAIGLAIGGYFLSRQLREEKELGPEELIAAFDSGEMKLKMGTGKPGGGGGAKGKAGGRRGSKGGGGGKDGEFVPGMSYEEAMAMGVNLGSAKSAAGQRQLTAGDIDSIMNKNVRKFLPCMSGESTKRVDMNIAVAGDGSVIGVTVSQGSPKLKSCVTSVVRRIKFPASNAPRTATSWFFEIY
jgi:serine/threonine-protein kinase